MKRWGMPIASALALGVLGVSALAGTLASGLQSGEHMSPFDVTDVSGPNKGRTLCYV